MAKVGGGGGGGVGDGASRAWNDAALNRVHHGVPRILPPMGHGGRSGRMTPSQMAIFFNQEDYSFPTWNPSAWKDDNGAAADNRDDATTTGRLDTGDRYEASPPAASDKDMEGVKAAEPNPDPDLGSNKKVTSNLG